MKTPCKDCQVREAGCWTRCQRYMAFSKECEERRAKSLQESFVNDYMFHSKTAGKGRL